MKLQLDGNNIRLRLQESELAALAAWNELKQAWPSPDGTEVCCRLTLDPESTAAECIGSLMNLRVGLPRNEFLAFAAERPRRDGFSFSCGQIRVTVEIDVRSSHKERQRVREPSDPERFDPHQ